MYRRSVREPQNFITLGLALLASVQQVRALERVQQHEYALLRLLKNTLEASKMRMPLYSGYVYSDRSSVVRIKGVPL